MNYKIIKVEQGEVGYPIVVSGIASPPKQLYYMGPLNDLLNRKRVAIVGTRNMTPYGRRVTRDFATALAEQGIVIISGLALGVDALAHRSALEVGGLTMAVLPGPLNKIAPPSHSDLAQQILTQGGVLMSEYPPGSHAAKQNFVARNRLMAGFADAVLITEAGEKSGALHTGKFGLDQDKPVFAVPGNITNQYSIGANNFLKSQHASPATSHIDILNALDMYNHKIPAKMVRGRNQHEQTVLDIMLRGISDGEEVLEKSGLTVSELSQVLTMLEIASKIRPLGGNQWAIN